jgi:hypothetical protein
MSLLHPLMTSLEVIMATQVFIASVTLLGFSPSPFHLELDSFEQSKDEGRGFARLPQPLVTTP